MIEAKGHNGQIEFDGRYVRILRRGFLARTSVGKGEKRIPLASIVSVQWKPAGALVNGFIQFETAGAGGTRSRSMRQSTDAAHDENSVLFTKKQAAEFEHLRSAVEDSLAMHHTPLTRAAAPVSVADELLKLAALVQQGILSPQEFEAQKARLISGS